MILCVCVRFVILPSTVSLWREEEDRTFPGSDLVLCTGGPDLKEVVASIVDLGGGSFLSGEAADELGVGVNSAGDIFRLFLWWGGGKVTAI